MKDVKKKGKIKMRLLKRRLIEYNARISDNLMLWKDGAIFRSEYLQIKANYQNKIKSVKKEIQSLIYKKKKEKCANNNILPLPSCQRI